MNWLNVKLIFTREVRDQLRDRRTLFVIAVLPMLLYPLLGMSLFQITQFVRENPTRVLVVGAEDLEGLPPLLEDNRFASNLFLEPEDADLLELTFAHETLGDGSLGGNRRIARHAAACAAVEAGEYNAAFYFPNDFGEKARAYREAIRQWSRRHDLDTTGTTPDAALPDAIPDVATSNATDTIPELEVRPEIIYSTVTDESELAYIRLSNVWRQWNTEIGQSTLSERGLPANAASPLGLATTNLAERTGRHGTAIWSKILPVLLLLWAMSGAFYPAIDLCAGEKERGTLETLLSSPAERSEIVLGKLLTTMLFSMATVVLNLLSLGATGWLILAKLPDIGPPPAMAIVWLAIVLVPVSALFGALCLALAAFARSTKEGQYYFIPLIMVTVPLVILPMAPSVELNLGNSLIPITGIVLLLRSMLEGAYWQTLEFALPVAAVTLGCCLLSIRWAIDQFNSESVLFREGERLDMGLRLRNMLANRGPTPTVIGAVSCGMLILVIRFFFNLALSEPNNFHDLAVSTLATQLLVVAATTILMTAMLTRSPRRTLLLRWPRSVAIPAAALLAVVIHPTAHALQLVIGRLYPVNKELIEKVNGLLSDAPSFWHVALLIAVLPAVCEELAFRGFILSGFRHLGHKWRAIIYSALFFGVTHGILQQSMMACVLGLVIGYVAIQTESILPAMTFHLIHNFLAVAAMKIPMDLLERWPALGKLVLLSEENGLMFRAPVVLVSLVLTFTILAWFGRLPYHKSKEERREDALRDASKEPPKRTPSEKIGLFARICG